MYPVSKDDEVCPFIEHLNHNKVSINDFDDFEYSQNNIYDLAYMGIKNYD